MNLWQLQSESTFTFGHKKEISERERDREKERESEKPRSCLGESEKQRSFGPCLVQIGMREHTTT